MKKDGSARSSPFRCSQLSLIFVGGWGGITVGTIIAVIVVLNPDDTLSKSIVATSPVGGNAMPEIDTKRSDVFSLFRPIDFTSCSDTKLDEAPVSKTALMTLLLFELFTSTWAVARRVLGVATQARTGCGCGCFLLSSWRRVWCFLLQIFQPPEEHELTEQLERRQLEQRFFIRTKSLLWTRVMRLNFSHIWM